MNAKTKTTAPSGPRVTRRRMQQDLARLGVRRGDILLVHSSLRAIGWVDGGTDAVIDALLAAVGREGTVLMPTLTGSREYSTTNPPRFDPARDPCWTGKIPEAFRQRPGVIRSWHPTHSVAALGPRANDLVWCHHLAWSPCGAGTPYVANGLLGGKVLMLGCRLASCTTCHSVEELAGVRYVCQPEPVEALIALGRGRTLKRRMLIHLYGPKRDYCRQTPWCLRRGIARRGPIGQADSLLLDARAFIDAMVAKHQKDPEVFLATAERGKGWATRGQPADA